MFRIFVHVALFCAVGFHLSALAAQAPRQESSPNEPDRAWSDWGTVSNGIQSRVQLPKKIEEHDTFQPTIELRTVVYQVPDWMNALNPRGASISFFLVSTENGAVFEIPQQQFSGPPMSDRGEYALPLDGRILPSTTGQFRTIDQSIPPGPYLSFVRYAHSYGPNDSWQGTMIEWIEKHYWDGAVVSASSSIQIVPEIPKTMTVRVPRRLSLLKKANWPGDRVSLYIVYTPADSEEVSVPIRNGHWIGHTVDQLGGGGKLAGGPIEPDEMNGIAQWHQYQGGDFKATYLIKVFESCAEDPRMMGPCGYKVLWEKSLDVDATEREIANLPVKYLLPAKPEPPPAPQDNG